MASFSIGQSIRLLMNPGESLHWRGIFPIFSDSLNTASVTSGRVSFPLMTSTSLMIGTGFMKCMPMTLSGRLVLGDNSFIEMLEVLVASIAVSLHISSSSLNAEIFRLVTSGIASMIKSASKAACLDTEVEIKDIATSASSWVIFCLRLVSKGFFDGLNSLVDVFLFYINHHHGKPEHEATWAIPAPI